MKTKDKISQTATVINIKMQIIIVASESKSWLLLKVTKVTDHMTSLQAKILVLVILLIIHNCIKITPNTKSWRKHRPNNRVKEVDKQVEEAISIIDQWTRVIKTNWLFKNKFNNCKNSKWASSRPLRTNFKELLPTLSLAVQDLQLLVIRPRNKSSTTIWRRNFWQSTKRCRRKDKEATWTCSWKDQEVPMVSHQVNNRFRTSSIKRISSRSTTLCKIAPMFSTQLSQPWKVQMVQAHKPPPTLTTLRPLPR